MNKMMRYKKKEIVFTFIAGILLIALYGLIFNFSAQDGDTSGSLSYFISEKCVKRFNFVTRSNWTENMLESMARYFENPIRKLAHFGEYTCMGILVGVILSQWMKRGKRLWLIGGLWILLSAAADEFHQFFIPGRYSSLADVLLDTVGGLFGILLCIRLLYLLARKKKK